MNYQKLDAALVMATDDAQNREAPDLEVFIHTEPILDSTATAVLESFAIKGVASGMDVFTAKLSPNAICQLSEQPWVKSLNLSQELRLVNRGLSMRRLGV